jgi:hypothetical protein
MNLRKRIQQARVVRIALEMEKPGKRAGFSEGGFANSLSEFKVWDERGILYTSPDESHWELSEIEDKSDAGIRAILEGWKAKYQARKAAATAT